MSNSKGEILFQKPILHTLNHLYKKNSSQRDKAQLKINNAMKQSKLIFPISSNNTLLKIVIQSQTATLIILAMEINKVVEMGVRVEKSQVICNR